MLNLLNWNKPLIVNGVQYQNSNEALQALQGFDGEIEVRINWKEPAIPEQPQNKPELPQERIVYRIEVKQYMTKSASPEFDFMAKWNNNKPMPLRVMFGEVLEETKGMVKMRLHGRAEKQSCKCMRCGKELKNPVSRHFGLGIECITHYPISITEKDIQDIQDEEKVNQILDADLRKVEWEGWIIKSAIQNQKVI
jgi:hypothetical protein